MVEILHWNAPDYWTVSHIAAAYGVSEATVSKEWTKRPQWPAAVDGIGKRRSTRGRPAKVYFRDFRDAVKAAVELHRANTSGAGPAPPPARQWPGKDRVTLAEIARRLDRDYTEVRNYPRLYPPGSNNPFPPVGPDRMRTWSDITGWQARRPGMGNRRTAARTTETTTDEGHAIP
ncbi:hypothetical protein [Streptomyces sp. NPDC056361]|uniref:hypothetical protein n=1 Tax=Streptomyces sp. NPDC056361 TaxID=3345795 RepID=UPI0035D9166D